MALMNVAIKDAYISGFETKYFYRTWRPTTAITRGDEDGNKWTIPGPFTPLISTPCFPSYPSNHGTGSGAARTILERAYGRFGHSLTVFHPNAPGITRTYSDLRAITDDRTHVCMAASISVMIRSPVSGRATRLASAEKAK